MVMTRPAVAANITAVVSHPRIFILRMFVQRPMIRGLFVIRITGSMRKGT